MKIKNSKGFTLIEALVSVAIFLLFAVGIYGGITFIFKIIYQSRIKIIETAILSEELEIVRNLSFENVGLQNGVPAGVLLPSKIITRNKINFTVQTSVRNIDDPYDGTAGGSPLDTSPADYKLVEISVSCVSCNQRYPLIANTTIAPKGLEGATKNGHLFINVFDSNGHGVSQATVHIINTSTKPDIDITETPDNDGWFRLIDTPTGTLAYNITVSKDGYSSDYTIYPSTANAHPSKLPSNVASQMVTEIYFSIDALANLNVKTFDKNCNALGSIPFSLQGEKIVGTDPLVYKYNKSFTTNSSGQYNLGQMEWDKYYLGTNSGSYVIGGSIPLLPFDLLPNSMQEIILIMQPKTTNSFLVQLKDAGTGLPVSDANVRLYNGYNFDETKITGLGYVRQTDWSGGSGQVSYTTLNKYFSDGGSVVNNSPSGDLKLKKSGSYYLTSGILESSTFDLGQTVNFRNIIFSPTAQDLDTGTTPIKVQIASSNSSTPSSWIYLGPDGTFTTYYTPTSTSIWDGHDGKRYFRYKVFLSTAKNTKTPTLQELAFTFTDNCIAPGQVFFSGLSADNYYFEISKENYLTATDTIDISGNVNTVVNFSASP